MIKITSNIPKVYSATHYFNNIPLIGNCVINDMQSDTLMLKISVLSDKTEVLSFSESFTVSASQRNSFLLPLEKYNLSPDEKYINSETQPCTLQVRMAVNDGISTGTYACGVRFLPFGNIAPEMAPELLCTYIMPGLSFASGFARKALEACGKNPTAPLVARELFSLLLSEKLSFAKHLSDLPENLCVIRDYESIINSSNRSVTMTEAALIFCSCAERAGLDTTIIYLRKGAGNIRILVGIKLEKNIQLPIFSESILDLRQQIIDRNIICFDISGLLSTEDTDFYKNLQDTHEAIFKSNSSVAFCVNVSGARLCGVKSLHPIKTRKTENIKSNTEIIKDAILEIKKKDIQNTVYSFTPKDDSVLAICPVNKQITLGEDYTLLPLDDEIFTQNPDTIGKFTSFAGKYPTDIPRNLNEITKYNAKLSALSEKILENSKNNYIYSYPLSHFLCCDKTNPVRIREEFFSSINRLSEKFSKVGCGEFVKLYAAYGIIEFSNSEKAIYVPCIFVPCELSVNGNTVQLHYGSEAPVINKSLFRKLSEQFSDSDSSYDLLLDGSLSECVNAFARLCEKSDGKIILHRDIVLSAFDLSYTLMKNCIENSRETSFGRYLESGKYEKSENQPGVFGRFEATLPFEASSEVKNAIKGAENDSVIISGPCGSGKKEAVANIIAREVQKGGDLLVVSKYSDSLYSLENAFASAGLSELCLVVEDKEKTKAKILSDIRRFTEIPATPDKADGDIGETENRLDTFSSELYNIHNFGYSLHTCIDEYCTLNTENEEKPISIDIDPRDMTREMSDKVFEVSESLSECARNIYSELERKTISDSGLSFVKTVNEISDKEFRELVLSSKEKLEVFAEKCSFVFKSFGISEKDICDVRSFVAFGDFLELIMTMGVANIPEKLFSGSVYKNAKHLETLCDILSKIQRAQNDCLGIYENLNSEKAEEFYGRWYADNKIFTKNTIIRELREYLPKKAILTHSKAKTILDALHEKSRLEKELDTHSKKAQELLGDFWNGTQTDVDTLLKILTFAQSTDSYIRKIFKDENLCSSILLGGISKLISVLFENKETNADFISALSAFRKLCDKSFREGLLPQISNILTLDMYELKFENGVLGKNGLSDYLLSLCENMSALLLIPQYNRTKKEAAALGLSAFSDYIENTYECEKVNILFSKSIYFAFAKYITDSKECFKNYDITELRRKYCELFELEKKLASHNLVLLHRKSFIKYISTGNGKSETYALCESLRNSCVSLQELFSKHSSILRTMYPVLFALSDFACTLDKFPKTFILLDSEKTTVTEVIALCSVFDKCIFSSSGVLNKDSIIYSLPSGIPEFKLSYISSCQNTDFLRFSKAVLTAQISYTEDICASKITLVKCDGGLYDKNSGANKIEAVAACEKAISLCREYGFENVGIITMTKAQRNEAEIALDLLSSKYSEEKIKDIPVRYIGSMGDLSRKHTVVSLTFGKNIYSVTRSFDLLCTPYLIKSGNISPLCELLCCENELYIVTSIEDSEIMLDGKLPGAPDIYALLLYASTGALPLYEKTEGVSSGKNIRDSLCKKLDITDTPTQLPNILYKDNTVYLFDNVYIRDTYDRERLLPKELLGKGYNVEFINICDLM